jgi:hypothetical protein
MLMLIGDILILLACWESDPMGGKGQRRSGRVQIRAL